MKRKEPLNKEQGYQYVLRLLQQRSYSEAMLRQKLRLHEVSEDDCSLILTKLRDMGLLNDATYAQSVARTEAIYRKSSQRYIEQKLKQKGIPPSLIQLSVNALGDDELARAQHHADKYLKRQPVPITYETKQKLAGYLYRRGFSGSIINQVLHAITSG